MRPPHPPLQVALYEPEIPPNAGSVARLCAATATPLHLIGRLGFSFTHPAARRAGMDYWEGVDWKRHVAWADFAAEMGLARLRMVSTRAESPIWDAGFAAGDVLVFGPESRGLPAELIEAHRADAVRIPMVAGTRSLNLATAVAITLYEALRQAGAREG